jgi:hypothetical protein
VIIDSPSTAPYHRATIEALAHAIETRHDIEVTVTRSDRIVSLGDGVVLGPGTPYNDPEAAEEVCATARERGLPLVAT